MEDTSMQIIARIRNDFSGKFGIPRQSGLVDELKSYVIFEPGFRNADMIRGLEGFSHIWLLWEFSQSRSWAPTVRPPRLGGNTRMGVFATRSPFRPSPVGLSCVRLERVTPFSRFGPILRVAGADLMNDTPIYDIKPYLPYTDSKPAATTGYVDHYDHTLLDVVCPEDLLSLLPENRRDALLAVLAQDPRPAYQHNPDRIYGLGFAGFNVCFYVDDSKLTVVEIKPNSVVLPDLSDSDYSPDPVSFDLINEDQDH